MQRPTRRTLAVRRSRRRVARAAAWIWTAGIFIACLWPGKELPHSNLPFIDKWTHFVLFGMFSVLWLRAWPARKASRYLLIPVLATFVGILVEVLQMVFTSLGRSGEVMDAVADAVGGVLGAAIWAIANRVRNRPATVQA